MPSSVPRTDGRWRTRTSGGQQGSLRPIWCASSKSAQKAKIPVRSARLHPEGAIVVIFGEPELDFGQISRRSAVARDAEHRIVLDDLLGALEHELHAPEVAERCPATLGV